MITARSLILLLISAAGLAVPVWAETVVTLRSPDGSLTLLVEHTGAGTLNYQIRRNDEPVIKPSSLGLTLNNTRFKSGLTVVERSPVSATNQQYTLLHGKQKQVDYTANEAAIQLQNTTGQLLTIRFRLSDDGLAYRYELNGESADTRVVLQEHTSITFYPATIGWLQPKAAAQSGWMNTNPSYEEEYLSGAVSELITPYGHGWVYPALFHYNNHFIAVTEVGIPEGYAASHLTSEHNGTFNLSFPHRNETLTNGAVLPESALPFHSPWRIIVVGDLATITESTLGTDLAEPATLAATDFIKPGVAAWSWGLLKDESVNEETQKQFIDYAAAMHWPYVLVDVNWDQNIGYDGIAELARYGAAKQVRLWLWFNSSGAWNQTVYSPKGALLTRADRQAVFDKLQKMGIAGIKVDFFPGDGAAVWDYFKGILTDAADYGLMVNFHGVTLPRGLQRTYPNLMTAEGIKGQEMITFFQDFADRQAFHATMQPFTRNLFDPMDFTPMVLGDIPNIERRTSNSFELAETVLFYSGVQHLVTTPAQMAVVEPYVKAFLQSLPTTWDETRFIEGYPGEYVVLARHSGCQWYIAGINAQPKARTVRLKAQHFPLNNAKILVQGSTPRDTELQLHDQGDVAIVMQSDGGFVLTTQRENHDDCNVD